MHVYVTCTHVAVCVAEVQAMLLSDVLVFLQEKDTKYVFASLVSDIGFCVSSKVRSHDVFSQCVSVTVCRISVPQSSHCRT